MKLKWNYYIENKSPAHLKLNSKVDFENVITEQLKHTAKEYYSNRQSISAQWANMGGQGTIGCNFDFLYSFGVHNHLL